MTGTVSRVLLWLFVINLGIALGAGLYEARIVVPEWIDAPGAVPEWNPEAAARAVQWASLNHVRHLLVLVALLCAMKAFSLVYAREGETTS